MPSWYCAKVGSCPCRPSGCTSKRATQNAKSEAFKSEALYPYGILNGYSFGFIRVLLFVESSDQPPCLGSLFIFTFHTRPGPSSPNVPIVADSEEYAPGWQQDRDVETPAVSAVSAVCRRSSSTAVSDTHVDGCQDFHQDHIIYIYILYVYIYISYLKITPPSFFLLKFPWVVPRHIQTRSWKPQKTWNQAGLSWFIMVYPSGAINVSPDRSKKNAASFSSHFPRAPVGRLMKGCVWRCSRCCREIPPCGCVHSISSL